MGIGAASAARARHRSPRRCGFGAIREATWTLDRGEPNATAIPPSPGRPASGGTMTPTEIACPLSKAALSRQSGRKSGHVYAIDLVAVSRPKVLPDREFVIDGGDLVQPVCPSSRPGSDEPVPLLRGRAWHRLKPWCSAMSHPYRSNAWAARHDPESEDCLGVYLSSQTSSIRQPLKMLLTMTVHPLTWGCQHIARRS